MKNTAIKSEFTQPVSIGIPRAIQIRKLFEKSLYVEITSKAIAKARQGGFTSVCFQINKNKSLEALIHLFFMGKAVSQDVAHSALQPVNIDIWLEAGLIEINDGQVTSLVKFYPYQGLLLISDFEWAAKTVSDRQPVMGITGSTELLANLTVRRSSRLTLDLGTGTGAQALLAARHSEKVIAVDICPRSLAFARFNAQLNGFKNIEFIEGDLFQAVEGQTFDLIVSNPPFLISPENQSSYWDTPLDGDELARNIVREMPRFLNQGGFGQIICNWIQPGSENWMDRLYEWYKGSGCDGWVIRKKETEPEKYAQSWLKDFKTKDREQRQKAWLDYYQQNDIAAVGFGLITLHQNNKSSPWSRIDKSLPEISQDCGAYIDRIFQSWDFLNQTLKDHVLLNQQFRVCPHLRINKQSAPEVEGVWKTVSVRLILTQGILHQYDVDMAIMEIVMYCKPHIKLGKVLNMVAVIQKKPPDEFISTYLPACRKLIAQGFLWPEYRASDYRIENNSILESKNTESHFFNKESG